MKEHTIPRLHKPYFNKKGEAAAYDGESFVSRSIQRGMWGGSLTESHWLKVANWDSIHWNSLLEGEYIQQDLFHESNMHYNITSKGNWATVKAQRWKKPWLPEAGTEVASRCHLLCLKFQICCKKYVALWLLVFSGVIHNYIVYIDHIQNMKEGQKLSGCQASFKAITCNPDHLYRMR